jgi:hypothetical protein
MCCIRIRTRATKCVLCRVLKAVWNVSRLPIFTGSAYVRVVLAPSLVKLRTVGGVLRMNATRSGNAKPGELPNEPQGADLMRAAGLGQDA